MGTRRTAFNTLPLEKISLFNQSETKDFFSEFHDYIRSETNTMNNSVKNAIRKELALSIINLNNNFSKSEINKQWLFDFYNIVEKNGTKCNYTSRSWKLFLIFILENNYYDDCELDYLASKLNQIKKVENIKGILFPIFQSNYTTAFFDIVENTFHYGAKNHMILIQYDTDNIFIKRMLLDFLNSYPHCYKAYTKRFFTDFIKSLYPYKIQSYLDFNIEIFNAQFNYFESFKVKELTTTIKFFYVFLLNIRGNENLITWKDGIDKNYLLNKDFIRFYVENYKLVALNPHDSIPYFDNWMVMPNDYEKLTASLKPNIYHPVTFSNIKDEKLKYYAKEWFWEILRTSLPHRIVSVTRLSRFLEFRDDLRGKGIMKFTENKKLENISAEEIFAYSAYIRSQNYAPGTILEHFSPVVSFLNLIMEKDYTVDSACFQYLKVKQFKAHQTQQPDDIPEDELLLIIERMIIKARDNLFYQLYYIIFCLIKTTPLRISNTLDLHTNCIISKGRGIYAIKSISKTSKGDKSDIQITAENKRLIDITIQLTQNARNSCKDKTLKKYLFLVNYYGQRNKLITERTFNEYLKSVCREVNVPAYTASNVRKTYMTEIVENATKQGISLIELSALTKHISIDTTNNSYVRQKLRNYLEATNGILIGDITIEGEIRSHYNNNNTNKDIVNYKCGYCGKNSCTVLGTADCLMCKGFITTPERIPYFEAVIDIINEEIFSTDIECEKNNLYALKRLYVAYLEQLYLKLEEDKICRA